VWHVWEECGLSTCPKVHKDLCWTVQGVLCRVTSSHSNPRFGHRQLVVQKRKFFFKKLSLFWLLTTHYFTKTERNEILSFGSFSIMGKIQCVNLSWTFSPLFIISLQLSHFLLKILFLYLLNLFPLKINCLHWCVSVISPLCPSSVYLSFLLQGARWIICSHGSETGRHIMIFSEVQRFGSDIWRTESYKYFFS
jgi:hypothetical protein